MKQDSLGKSFWSLNYALTGGAFNDNFFKTVLALMITSQFSGEKQASLIALTGAMLVFPFIIFSPIAGWCADRFSKTKITIIIRSLEPLLVMAGSYFLFQGQTWALLGVLFFFGLQSAIFSPSKYGLIPELVSEKKLSEGNAFVEMFTFIGILLGTTVAGQIQAFENQDLISTVILFTISFASIYFAFQIKPQPARDPSAKLYLNPFKTFWKSFSEIILNKDLFLVLLATAWFWFVGAIFQLSIFIYATEQLQATTYQSGLLVTFLTIGVGLGSYLAGVISRGRIEIGITPIALIGIALTCFSIAFLDLTLIKACLIFSLLGLFSGLFIIPLNAFYQAESPIEKRGSYLAAGNLIFNTSILFSSLFLWLSNGVFKLPITYLYAAVGISSILLTLVAFKRVPVLTFRCINWIITNTIYRLRSLGYDHIPQNSGALLVCNHVSYVDALHVLAASRRPVRFIMYKPFTELPIIRRITKLFEVIPINEADSAKEIRSALKTARNAIKEGELVCIFAEGQLSRHGNMTPFLRGLELIMKGLKEPIIPIHIDQIWGSIFSFEGGKVLKKLPKQIPYPVTVNFGEALASNATAFEIRQKVAELGVESYYLRKSYKERLDYRMLQGLAGNRLKTIMSDSTGAKKRGFQLLASVITLQDLFKLKTANQKHIGVLLPNTVAGATTNIALMLAEKVSVNLNYTASDKAIKSALDQAEIKTVVTSDSFLEKINLNLPEDINLIKLEELKTEISFLDKLKNILLSFLPINILKLILVPKKADSEDTATIIFSSGSSGEPKGVELSHANICSNIEALFQVAGITKRDSILGVLPLFHSFGYSGTLWLPLLAGIPVAYHPNPMDAGTIGEMVEKHKSSMLLSTPAFLSTYIRKCTKEQFQSLRLVITGAEKLPAAIAEKFQNKFDIIPYEGYGCTELSPVVSLNVPNQSDHLVDQVGNKPGKTGHPLPNLAIKVVNPETHQDLPMDTDGLVLVKGPNVMKGYLGNPEKTAEVMHQDWYITGDIGNLDQDGFLEITGRLSRFSKIAGEMIPHGAIEEAIMKALDISEKVIAVTAIPDQKRGEKIIVLHSVDLNAEEISDKLSDYGLPNLWIPKKDAWKKVDQIPLLGSGKLDLQSIKKIANNN